MAEVIQTYELVEFAVKMVDVFQQYADKIYRLLHYPDCDFNHKLSSLLKDYVGKVLGNQGELTYPDYIQTFIVSSMITNFSYWYEHSDQYSLIEINLLGQTLILNGLNSMNAIHEAQRAFEGEAERLGLKNEADVVEMIKEIRDEKLKENSHKS